MRTPARSRNVLFTAAHLLWFVSANGYIDGKGDNRLEMQRILQTAQKMNRLQYACVPLRLDSLAAFTVFPSVSEAYPCDFLEHSHFP
jgi:hypothetical protein